jgi:hypothetical protein
MITLHGSGTPPPSSTLHDAMTTELGDGIILELRVVPEVLDIVDGDRR